MDGGLSVLCPLWSLTRGYESENRADCLEMMIACLHSWCLGCPVNGMMEGILGKTEAQEFL